MSKIDLFNHSMGIQDFLIPHSQNHIPTAKPLASTGNAEINMVERFNAHDIKAFAERFLSPEVGDGEALRPDIFNRVIKNFAEKYQGENDPDVQVFLNDILKPMIANKELLQAYSNLMLGG